MIKSKFLRNIGFGLVVVVFLVGITQSASSQPYTTISITGRVSGPFGTVNLHVSGKGAPSLINGKGVGFHIEFIAEARFTVTGSISGNIITLEGEVTQAPLSYSFLLGTPILVYADASNGYIYHSIGPFIIYPTLIEEFEGIGTVVINN